MAVTRHQPFDGSSLAESIVVFGIETLARLSQGQTGAIPGKSCFGGASAAWTKVLTPESAAAKMVRLNCRRRLTACSFMFMQSRLYAAREFLTMQESVFLLL